MMRNSNIVTLTSNDEVRVQAIFDFLLDEGESIVSAAEKALGHATDLQDMDIEFVEWLSDGTLTLLDEEVVPMSALDEGDEDTITRLEGVVATLKVEEPATVTSIPTPAASPALVKKGREARLAKEQQERRRPRLAYSTSSTR